MERIMEHHLQTIQTFGASMMVFFFNVMYTHRKFNIAPENGWLEDYLPFGRVAFQGLC